MRGSQVVKAQGYGLANVEHQVAVRPETIFQSGSLGKQFTAVAVLLQVEENRLALEDPLARFYPDAPAGWARITIRHLLTHTSGIADYGRAEVDYRKDYSDEEFARVAYGLEAGVPPGSRFSYSNTGYALLGFIVRKVSGRFYGDVLAERVFAPLGMTTARVISEADVVANRAAGYRLVEGALQNQAWVSPQLNTMADGSLYLSLLDLVAWDRGLRAGAVLQPASWAQVFTPATLADGTRVPYGFGWRLFEVAGQRVERHAGAWQGFKTEIARYRGSDLTLIVLCNLAQAIRRGSPTGSRGSWCRSSRNRSRLDARLADDLEPHRSRAGADQADRLRGRAREIDRAPLVRREAVVDAHDDALAGGRKRHLHARAERPVRVCGRERVLIEALAARGLLPVEPGAIPGRHALHHRPDRRPLRRRELIVLRIRIVRASRQQSRQPQPSAVAGRFMPPCVRAACSWPRRRPSGRTASGSCRRS